MTISLVEQLAAGGLPEYRVVAARSASSEQKEAARRGRFTVFGHELELGVPIDWNQNPFGSRSGAYELHTLQLLDVLVRSYLDDEDREALVQAVAIALDWSAANPRGGEGVSEFAWYDMAVGLRAGYLGFLARAAAHAGVLKESEAEALVRSLEQHGAYLADEENYAEGHNHGLFQDEGLILLAGYVSFLDAAAGWSELAWRRCARTLHGTIDWDEGAHLEHSPAYHLAITHYVRRLVELPNADHEELRPLLDRLEDTAGWLVLPDGTLPELGDTDNAETAKWALQAGADKSGLRFLRRSGVAIVKEGDSFLIVSAWYHGHGHKHADELSFVLYEAGHRVICDPGRYGYYEDEPARQYVRSAKAHNSLLIDGATADWRTAEPYGSGLVAAGGADGWYAIEGTNPLLESADHRRSFLFKPGALLVVVDEVHTGRSQGHARLLHFGPDVDVAAVEHGLTLRANGFCGAVSDWSDRHVERSLARGQTVPELRGWVFPRDREWVPTWTAELRTVGPELVAAMAISLQDEAVRVEHVERQGGVLCVTLSHDGSRTDLTVRGDGTALAVEARS